MSLEAGQVSLEAGQVSLDDLALYLVMVISRSDQWRHLVCLRY